MVLSGDDVPQRVTQWCTYVSTCNPDYSNTLLFPPSILPYHSFILTLNLTSQNPNLFLSSLLKVTYIAIVATPSITLWILWMILVCFGVWDMCFTNLATFKDARKIRPRKRRKCSNQNHMTKESKRVIVRWTTPFNSKLSRHSLATPTLEKVKYFLRLYTHNRPPTKSHPHHIQIIDENLSPVHFEHWHEWNN